MGKFDPFSTRELRRLRRAWVREKAPRLLIAGAGLIVMLALATLVLMWTFPSPVSWYVVGAVHASLVATALHIFNTAFLASDRDAIRHIRGAWGEDNTRDELLRARRRRLVWGSVDSIDLQVGDIDHVVVTRRGGVLAIDSKWRNEVSREDVAHMARAAKRAKLRVEGMARTVLVSDHKARHRARVSGLPVTPVVVLWGSAQHSLGDGVVVDDVRFVRGRNLVDWIRTLDGNPATRTAAADVLKRVRSFRDGTVERVRATS